MDAVNEIIQPVRRPAVSLWRTAVVLFKLRIVSLLVLSAFGGAAFRHPDCWAGFRLGLGVAGHHRDVVRSRRIWY